MSEYRPISLCNVVYKFITKALANHLKRYLDPTILTTQNAFVPDRLITDNAMIAFELMHSLKPRINIKKGWLSLKLDKNKAFDKVE